MKNWKTMVGLALLAGVFLLAGPVPAADDVRLGRKVVPVFQAINLKLDAEKSDYTGSVEIRLDVKEPIRVFRLHAQGQQLQSVDLQGEQGTIRASHHVNEKGVLSISTEELLEPGSYRLNIRFQNLFNARAVGLYRMENSGTGYVFSQFEATDARRAFPCFDEPIFKIPYQITLNIPKGQVAVTNTPLESTAVSGGWTTLTFRKTRPLPSYLLAIAEGPLESVAIPGLSVPGRIYTVAGQAHLTEVAAGMTPRILAALEKFFGRPYPYAKLDLLAIPEYWPGAMENAGAVTFADRLLLVDPKNASTAQKRALASVTAHELAHMWFGDLVTLSWWDDMWLNESFATWMGGKVVEELFPEYKSAVAARLSVQGLMNSDARPSTKPIRKPVTSVADLFEDLGLAYGKGEKVLGMMEQWMGPETFMKGIRQYLQDHTWKNATAEDLWSALSKASGLDMEAPLSSFLDQPGLPMVTVDVEPGGVLKMTQRRFLNEGVTAPAETWIFPVRIKYAAGGKTATRTVILDRGTRKLELGADPDWVMPDAGAYGYYRWNIPAPMLVEMARHAADRLSETERVAFLGNASALLDTDALSGDDYLEILNSFAGDAQPDVLSSVVSGLAKVESAFVPDELRRDFARYVRSMLRPLLNRFGFQKRAGENEAVTLFRPRLIKWLGDEGGDGEVRRKALKMARAYLTSPASVDAALADVVLGLAAIDGDEELFKAYRKNFEEAREPAVRGRYLSALGRFADVDLQEKALQYVLEGPVRPNELFQIPRGLGRTEAGEARLFTWLTRHFEALSARIPPQFVASLPFFAGGCSSDRLEAARRFFSDPAHQVQGTGRTLAKLSDQVHDCVRLRKREGPAVEAYLRPRRASGAP